MAIVQCVPNFSEGRDLDKIEKIVNPLRGKEGVKLLNYEADKNYNRLVVTVIGEPEKVKNAVFAAIGVAKDVIDMNTHKGQHSRFGATDVCPFIPIKGMDMDDAVKIANELGEMVAKEYEIPVFLYECAATKPERENLATVRKGEYEGLDEKLQDPNWMPDYGANKKHKTAGAIAIGARRPLIAYNINPRTREYMIASHLSAEPGAKKALSMMELEPFLDMDMRLGEGSGAALAFNIIEASNFVYKNMATFDEIDMGR